MSGSSPSSRGSCHGAAPPAAAFSARCWASANTGFCVSGQESLLPLTNLLTHSTPAEMNTSPSPALIAWKAIRVVCSDDEQYRVTVVPGRWSCPSITATTRAMLNPCSPPGSPQPSIRSPMSAGSSCGTLANAAATICAARSSGGIAVREPLNARPIGDRAVATITASGMAPASSRTGHPDYDTTSLADQPASPGHRQGSDPVDVSPGVQEEDSHAGI